MVIGVEGVDVGPLGEFRVERQPEKAAVAGAVDLVAEVGEDGRVGVGGIVKTRIRPDFSATKARPSGANRIAVGSSTEPKTVVSWNPAGSTTAPAAVAPSPVSSSQAKAVAASRRRKHIDDPSPATAQIVTGTPRRSGIRSSECHPPAGVPRGA